jgi:hypothetical protein
MTRVPREDAQIVVDAVKRNLLVALEKQGWSLPLWPTSIRTAWLFVQVGAMMRPIFFEPYHRDYEQMLRTLEVPLWNASEANRLAEAVRKARRLRSKDRTREVEVIQKQLEKCTSLVGFVYANGEPEVHLVPSLVAHPYVNRLSVRGSLEEHCRKALTWRSAAAIRLEHAGRRLGVLLLCDTAGGGFTIADKRRIAFAASLTSPFVDEGLRCGIFAVAAQSQLQTT